MTFMRCAVGILCALALLCSSGLGDEIQVLLRGTGATQAAPHGMGNVYAPEIHPDGDHWRMWYGGQGADGHDRIHCAESIDRQQWKQIGVVLDCGTANHVNDPSVVRVGDQWWMFYTLAEQDEADEIAAATSSDGLQWTKRGVVLRRGTGAVWDSAKVGRPSVRWEGNLFKMWFDGQPTPAAAAVDPIAAEVRRHSRAVGYAESRDGLSWQRRSTPVLGQGAGAIHVSRWQEAYVMVYESHEGTRWATSINGIDWVPRGLLLSRSGTDADQYGQVTPFLLLDDDSSSGMLYFGAASARTWDHNCIAAARLTLPTDSSRHVQP